jgi:hypothetical protein
MAMSNDAGEHQGEPAAVASGDIPVVAAPPLDPAAPQPSAVVSAAAPAEPAQIDALSAQAPEAPAAKPEPIMPRAAILAVRPDDKPGAEATEAAAAAPPASRGSGGSRFPLLAAGVALAATIGAIAGSAGMAGIEHMVFAAPVAVTHSEGNEEVRVLKDTVAQLRMNVKTLSDNLAALRTTINTSSSAANVQFTKITEALDRVERSKVERHVTTLTPSPEPVGSVPASPPSSVAPQAVLKPPVVDGWALRKVYNADAALVEGRYGVVEIAPGDLVPGLGRIQEIKRQDGRWVVVTSRGLIISSR